MQIQEQQSVTNLEVKDTHGSSIFDTQAVSNNMSSSEQCIDHNIPQHLLHILHALILIRHICSISLLLTVPVIIPDESMIIITSVTLQMEFAIVKNQVECHYWSTNELGNTCTATQNSKENRIASWPYRAS